MYNSLGKCALIQSMDFDSHVIIDFHTTSHCLGSASSRGENMEQNRSAIEINESMETFRVNRV
jgi:hypothetical protein